MDNAWLATGLRVLRGAVPELAARASALYASMDFGVYYRPEVNRIAFHIVPSTGESPCCYDTVVSESRMATYLGIASGQLPPKTYFGSWRAFPATCDYAFQETKPAGPTRTYLGQQVYEGSYAYAGMRIVPGWGGSAFEALMPALFVPEEAWGPRSWAVNHPNTVRAQIHHGLVEARLRVLGLLAVQQPGRRLLGLRRGRDRLRPRTATRPTTTPRSSTAASPAARTGPRSRRRRRPPTPTAW